MIPHIPTPLEMGMALQGSMAPEEFEKLSAPRKGRDPNTPRYQSAMKWLESRPNREGTSSQYAKEFGFSACYASEVFSVLYKAGHIDRKIPTNVSRKWPGYVWVAPKGRYGNDKK